jgi:zinc protease
MGVGTFRPQFFPGVPLRLLRLFALLVAAALSPVAQALAPAAKPIASVEGVTEYALPNGLRVLLFPEPSKPTITVNMTYLVGSRHEGYGETGMAHLLEHMLFKGTPKHTNIPQELTSHGARPNGTTSFDRTNYFETFSATDENLKWALDLEADRMVNSFVAKKDLDTEMTVVRNEYERGENNPESILEERVLSTSFLWHNYGKSTIGARSDIESVPIQNLQAFYRRFYQPDNAVLIVAGKIEADKVLPLIVAAFGSIPAPTRELNRTYTREPTQDGERSVTLRRVGDVQEVMVAYHVPAGSHPDAPALDILSETLGTEPSGRLYKALVETKKASSIGTEFLDLDEPGIFGAMAAVRKGASLDAATKILLTTLDNLPKNPPKQEEIDRARAELLKNIELALANPERIGLVLSEWIAKGDWRLFYLHRDRLKKVTPADVQRVSDSYLKPSNRTVGLFIPTDKPDRAPIPEAPDVATQLKDYKGDPEVAQGEAFDPSPLNVEKRTERTSLPGGLKLALLPKKTRGATVAATITLRFGDEKSLSNQGQLPALTASMLQRGTMKHTREQLKDALDKLRARVNIGSPSAASVSVSIETVRESLPAVLDLVAEMLRTPAFNPKDLEELRQEWLADLERDRSEPQALAPTALQRHLTPYNKGDPRYTPTLDERAADLTAAKRAQLQKFHASFYGASVGEVAIVGDFDAAATKTQLQKLLGDWKSPGTFKRVPSLYFDRPVITQTIETPDKENAMYRSGLNLQLRDDNADFPALVIGNFMLGGGFLNSRLAVRIRQKEGISYGVGAGFNASPLDELAQFYGYAIFAPQNGDKLVKAFGEELTRAVKEGFLPAEIADAKGGWQQTRTVQRAQDPSLASVLAQQLFIGRTMAWDAQLEQKVAALTPETITAAMQKHMDVSKLSWVRAGDFAKVAAKAEAK